MDQDASWYGELGLGPGNIPNFRSMSIVAKRSPISATAEHLLLLLFERFYSYIIVETQADMHLHVADS